MFTTPVKTNKKYKPEHVDSFREQKDIIKGSDGVKEDHVRNKTNWAKKSADKGYICITSREKQSKDKEFDLIIS